MTVHAVQPSNQVSAASREEARGFERSHYLLALSRLIHANESYRHYYSLLLERQERIEFLAKARALFNSPDTVQSDGSVDLTKSPQYEKLVERAKELREKAEDCRHLADGLGVEIQKLEEEDRQSGSSKNAGKIASLQEKRKELLETANEIDDTLNASCLLSGKTLYSREQREQVLDMNKTQSESMKTLNTFLHARVQRIQSDLVEVMNLLKKMHDNFHDSKKRIATNIRA